MGCRCDAREDGEAFGVAGFAGYEDCGSSSPLRTRGVC